MSCPKTPHLLKEYFSDNLSVIAREEIEAHVASCDDCRGELVDLLHTRDVLKGWQQEKAPHWDRGAELFRRENGTADRQLGFWGKLQWQLIPTGASIFMLVLVLFNVQVSSDLNGFNVSFGSSTVSALYVEKELEAFDERRGAKLDEAISLLEARQNSRNIELLQAVIYQNQQDTVTGLEQIYTVFEEQRLRDLEDMRVGYQQLMDSDYETLRSLRQLAQFVSYQE